MKKFSAIINYKRSLETRIASVYAETEEQAKVIAKLHFEEQHTDYDKESVTITAKEI